MLTKRIRIQLFVFAAIALIGVSYLGARYAGLDRLVMPRGYLVTVQLPDTGGSFTNGEVTYRGVTVGRIGDLRLTDSGVEVDLDIDDTDMKIPANTKAVVANRSAIGEQYIDLQPKSDEGPYLESGSVIPKSQTETPIPVSALVNNLNQFVESVPLGSLHTAVDELGTAFSGTGPDLRQLLQTTNSFTADAQAHLPQTLALIKDAKTVIGTQNQEAGAFKSFAGDLKLLTQQLKDSDGDIRKLLTTTPEFSQSLLKELTETGPNLGVVLANLLTVANITVTRNDGLEQTLVAYPNLAAFGTSVTQTDARARLGLVLNAFNPPLCVRGYENTVKHVGTDEHERPPNDKAYCAEPKGSPITVRGSQNGPGAGVGGISPSGNGTATGQGSSGQRGLGSLPGLLGSPLLAPSRLGSLPK
ncbi:MCE family protein [Pseudonocardiaceae bacterium YIM PH 21723]|nr:MCE family protein [Pseudonocardiaceae bacterium YIM PH 21723]